MATAQNATAVVGGLAPELVEDLEAIARERGRPLTLDETVRLRDRAEAVRRAFGQGGDPPDRDGLMPRSVRVGAVTLHALTLGARLTLRRLISWNQADPDLYDQDAWDLLQAYCFAHARDPEALGRLSSPEQAAAIGIEWGHRLTCTTAELLQAIDTLAQVAPAPPTPGANPADPAEVLDSVMRRYGMADPMQVLCSLPETTLSHLLDGAAGNARREVAAVAKARGELPPASADERADAVGEYTAERERILREVRQEVTDG